MPPADSAWKNWKWEAISGGEEAVPLLVQVGTLSSSHPSFGVSVFFLFGGGGDGVGRQGERSFKGVEDLAAQVVYEGGDDGGRKVAQKMAEAASRSARYGEQEESWLHLDG